MSNLRYFALLESGTPTAISVIVDGQPEPAGYSEITFTQFETYQQDIGNLGTLKESCINQIDATAGMVRSRFITTVPGQEATYMMKAQEARDIKLLNYVVDLINYPLVAAEIEATGEQLSQCVNNILMVENQWRQLAAIIEKERRFGKIGVNAAQTTVDAIVAKNSAIGSLDNIRP